MCPWRRCARLALSLSLLLASLALASAFSMSSSSPAGRGQLPLSAALPPSRDDALSIFMSAVRRVTPESLVSGAVEVLEGEVAVKVAGKRYEMGDGRIRMLAFGKASLLMAKAAESKLAGSLKRGIVISQPGEQAERMKEEGALTSQIFTGAPGNVCDQDSVNAATQGMALAREAAAEGGLLLVLISGGGSALFTSPAEGISLEDKIKTTRALQRHGASIQALNTVRKHISACKGGRLAVAAHPARVAALVLSDVIGDPLGSIASGPTVCDASTFADALRILEDVSEIPESVLKHVRAGVKGEVPETPKEGDERIKGADTVVVGSNTMAAEASRAKAEELGYASTVHTVGLCGDAEDAVAQIRKVLEQNLQSGGKRCAIFAGETTVRIGDAKGKGGRCTHMALLLSQALQGVGGWMVLCGGTDGQDGPTDAAGAMADGGTVLRGSSVGVGAESYLLDKDSYTFFDKEGGLLRTGLTGTNVMDVHIVLSDGKSV